MRTECLLQAAQRLERLFRRFAEQGRAGFDRVAQLLGAAANGVVVLHRGAGIQPADGLSELAKAAAHAFRHDHPRSLGERPVASRGLGAREAQGSKPAPRGLAVQRPDHARARPHALRLEARSERFSRGTLLCGQPGAVVGELRELHVEVARRSQGAQHGLGGPARARERRRQLLSEQTKGRVDTACGDAQLVQRFGIMPQARAGLVHVPRGQQAAQLHERHLARRGADVELRQAGARQRDGRFHIHRTAGGSRFALAGADRTLHRWPDECGDVFASVTKAGRAGPRPVSCAAATSTAN